MRDIFLSLLLLASASYANAQFGGPPGGGGSGYENPYGNGGGGNPFGNGGFQSFINNRATIVTAHAVCATVAVAFLFPVGGILIRLASFRGAWLLHGLFQIFAYIVLLVAVGLGLYMAHEIPSQAHLWNEAHPIIGLVVFGVLFLQPWLGLLHHFAFKKYSKRTFWSYAHIWIGRIFIALGIVNGGLGLQLSRKFGFFVAHKSTIIAYSVAASVMYLLYLLAAVYGESKRRKTRQQAAGTVTPPYKRERADGSGENVQYA